MAPACAQCDGPARWPIFLFAVKGAFVAVRPGDGHFSRCHVHLVLCHVMWCNSGELYLSNSNLHFKHQFQSSIQLESTCPILTCATNMNLYQKIHLQHQLGLHSRAPAAPCATKHTPKLYSKTCPPVSL